MSGEGKCETCGGDEDVTPFVDTYVVLNLCWECRIAALVVLMDALPIRPRPRGHEENR